MEPLQLIDEVRQHLELAEIFVLDQQPIQHGVRLDLSNDSLVIIYKTGKVVPQGRNKDATAAVLAGEPVESKSIMNIGSFNKPKPKPSVVVGDLAELPDGWCFCNVCGQLLAAVWAFCTCCGEECTRPAVQSLCDACGAKLDESWKYCASCGTEVSTVA